MDLPNRRLANPVEDPAQYLSREWLVTNGLGGYASGTISGIITRRYHGLLVAALPAPIGRMVMLSAVEGQMRLPSGQMLALDPESPEPAHDRPSRRDAQAMARVEFRLEL